MFWKLIEIIVRIVYFRRFRKAKKIGEAASLLADGKPEAALAHLEKHGNAVHQSLIPLFAFTQGKIFEALGKTEEAKSSYKAVVLTNPKDARADLELAILTGKEIQFDECRTWINRAIEKNDPKITPRAKEIETLLNEIEDGSKQTEFEQRALAMSEKKLIGDKSLGVPPDMTLLSQWMADAPDARDAIDDIALLVAYGEVQQGGTWKIGLSIEDIVIIKKDKTEIHPFAQVVPLLPPSIG